VVNLGAQVLVPDLLTRARAEKADVILVPQVVTQQDAHLRKHPRAGRGDPGRALAEAGPAAGRGRRAAVRRDRDRGARRGPDLRQGTTPGEVASYLAHLLRTGWDR
jgi:beta-lysine 5,6-aminomutase beta subunit